MLCEAIRSMLIRQAEKTDVVIISYHLSWFLSPLLMRLLPPILTPSILSFLSLRRAEHYQSPCPGWGERRPGVTEFGGWNLVTGVRCEFI